MIESLPMVCPNLNGYKASFDFYFCPWSNYYGWMDNNNVTDPATSVLKNRWTFTIHEGDVEVRDVLDIQTALEIKAVKPGSLLDYLGYPPGFIGRPDRPYPGQGFFRNIDLPAEKLISVIDIYRSYYCNQQEGFAYFLGRPETVGGEGYSFAKVSLVDLDKITKTLRLADASDLPIYDVLETVLLEHAEPTIYGSTLGSLVDWIIQQSLLTPLGGLPVRTYRMDLNRGILKDTTANFVSRVNIDPDNGFTIDTLRFANKMQKLLDRIDVSGGRFSDMMRMRWGVTPRNTLNVPDYLGSVSNFFGITDVVATASGMNSELDGRGNSVLGQQAGFAVGKVKRGNAPISFRSDQYGTLICMFSLVPIVTYSQGIEREDLKNSFAEVFDPAFNQLGYQDVDVLELNALPSFGYSSLNISSDTGVVFFDYPDKVGRRFAWSEYMSSLPRAHGLFAYGQDFDYRVNNRMYLKSQPLYECDDSVKPELLRPYGIADFTTYIDPSLQNNLFADVSARAQNFRLRVNFDIFMRRNIGSRVMPHL